MKKPIRRRPRGAVLVMVALGMVAMLGISGLALDGGHAFVNNTRLQNAVDSAALEAAKTLDEPGNSTADATAAARTLFVTNNAGAGNGELAAALAAGDLNLQYSDTLSPFVPGGANPQYVRATVNNLDLAASLTRVLGFSMFRVAASAVAGPSPTLERVCNVAPLMVCGNPDVASGGGPPFYGYSEGQRTVLKLGTGTGPSDDIGPGNFHLIDLAGLQGGNDIRYALAGDFAACLNAGETAEIDTAPGNKVGPTFQGINTRFGVYNGPFSQSDRTAYPSDHIAANPNTYLDYQAAYATPPSDWTPAPQGAPERRILAVPIGDCDGGANGSSTLGLLGFGCFYLTEEATQGGRGGSGIIGEFIGSCAAKGVPGPNPGNGPGPYIIQLYDDASWIDS